LTCPRIDSVSETARSVGVAQRMRLYNAIRTAHSSRSQGLCGVVACLI